MSTYRYQIANEKPKTYQMKHFLPLILVSIFIVGCQKQFQVESKTPSPDEITLNDSTLISLIVQFDTTAPAQSDTVAKYTFKYDSLKRLTKFEYVRYSNGVIDPNDIFRDKYYYFYNGTDTLPFKQIDSSQENQFSTNKLMFHTYQNGKILKDSVVDLFGIPTPDQVAKYTYYSDRVIDTVTKYPLIVNASPYGGYKVTYRQIQNNNVAFNFDSSYYYNSFSTPPSYVFDFTSRENLTYDNLKNPFYKFKGLNAYPFENFSYFPLFIDGSYLINQSKNNPRTYQKTQGSNVNTINFNYEYISNGYPKIVRIRDDFYSPAYMYKLKYFYTN